MKLPSEFKGRAARWGPTGQHITLVISTSWKDRARRHADHGHPASGSTSRQWPSTGGLGQVVWLWVFTCSHTCHLAHRAPRPTASTAVVCVDHHCCQGLVHTLRPAGWTPFTVLCTVLECATWQGWSGHGSPLR